LARHDYYNVLGLKRSATGDQIKKAYRTLALELHPDRRPDDPRAATRFQRVKLAYETLSDPEHRHRYDRLGPFYTESGRPPTPEELSEVLSDVVKGLFRRNKKDQPGEDLRFTLDLTLAEVATGCTQLIRVPRQAQCNPCRGSGAHPKDGRTPCLNCDGSGRSTAQRILRQSCSRCEGRGFIVIKACTLCNGQGRHGTEARIQVKIPAGVATGTQLRLAGQGNEGYGKAPAGQLTVLIQVQAHAFFERRGADLICELPISVGNAAMGTACKVPTLTGHTRIKIKPGSQSGELLRLAGLGLPSASKDPPGDLYFKIAIEIPTDLSEDQQELLKNFEKGLSTRSQPRREAFEKLLNEHLRPEDP
jgi:molecular chaperone DnaJ